MVDISDLGSFYNAQSNIRNIRNREAESENRILSQKQAEDMKNFAKTSDVEQFMSYKSEKRRTQDFIAVIENVQRKIDFTDSQIQNIQEIMIGFKHSLTLLNSSNGKSMQFESIAMGVLNQIEEILNSTLDNKYIFSGDNVFEKPTENIANVPNIIAGEYSTNYYNGGVTKEITLISDNYYVEHGVNADNKAFAKAIAAVHLSLSYSKKISENSGASLSLLENASKYLDQSLNELIEVRANLGNKNNEVSAKKEGLKSYSQLLQKAISGEIDTDILSETQKLSEERTNLEASFKATSKLSKVSYLDYM